MDIAIMDREDYKITLNSAKEIILRRRGKCLQLDLLMLLMGGTPKEDGQMDNYP
jgi:hypothetical protein